ncbi:hypothetical protein GCM10011369_17270 [Neiella marina]|uniref:Uncharacterized protein n=1 Tax=Neiella marina TaxID=508461 RepID=A0A8J2U4K5_9GAMM|nr:hypothetical protein [Neiella marina]GGA75941.1 hypothetical protein GCM10011369_17270 [Neiella marina]
MTTTKMIIRVLAILSLAWAGLANANDQISNLVVEQEIGPNQPPLIEMDLQVSKQRELHIAMIRLEDWKNVKRIQKRIKKSGPVKLRLPVADLKPGSYRIDAYLAPRRGGWTDRLAEPTSANLSVVTDAQLAEKKQAKKNQKPQFAKEDKVLLVNFPKTVGDEPVDLAVKFQISQNRTLKIKLLSSENWEEFGALDFPVERNGDLNVPLENLAAQFPPGKYAWVVQILDDNDEVVAKLGKHFTLGK